MSTKAWYVYDHTTGNELNPSNYYYIGGFYLECVNFTGTKICNLLGVYSEASQHPAAFSSRLTSYIIDAIAFESSQPPSFISKKYVYVHVPT